MNETNEAEDKIETAGKSRSEEVCVKRGGLATGADFAIISWPSGRGRITSRTAENYDQKTQTQTKTDAKEAENKKMIRHTRLTTVTKLLIFINLSPTKRVPVEFTCLTKKSLFTELQRHGEFEKNKKPDSRSPRQEKKVENLRGRNKKYKSAQ